MVPKKRPNKKPEVCTWHVTAMGCWLLTGTGVAWCLLWGGGQTTSQPHDSAHLSSSVSSKGSHGWKQSHSDPSRSGSCPERKVGSLLGLGVSLVGILRGKLVLLVPLVYWTWVSCYLLSSGRYHPGQCVWACKEGTATLEVPQPPIHHKASHGENPSATFELKMVTVSFYVERKDTYSFTLSFSIRWCFWKF